MAAGGFRTFVAGEVLDEDEINDYLMQGVLVFAGTAARGSAITAPVEGQFSYLSDSNSVQFYNGSAWTAFAGQSAPAVVSATTGSPTLGTVVSGADTFITYSYTGDGSITFSDAGLVDVLVLSGGGGGGGGSNANQAGGGGGAGGFLRSPTVLVSAGTVTIDVGAGGAGGVTPAVNASSGEQSSFGAILATPRGGGGIGGTSALPIDGCSGGGAGNNAGPGNGVFPLIGNNGGTFFTSATTVLKASGGGGGQTAAGSNGANSAGGNGGAGASSDITGSTLFYAGGGGGGARQGTAGSGGSSVGGNGGLDAVGGNATANRGSGGGGAGGSGTTNLAGGNGSAGVVIVRVKI